jgi:hypothetical protein
LGVVGSRRVTTWRLLVLGDVPLGLGPLDGTCI